MTQKNPAEQVEHIGEWIFEKPLHFTSTFCFRKKGDSIRLPIMTPFILQIHNGEECRRRNLPSFQHPFCITMAFVVLVCHKKILKAKSFITVIITVITLEAETFILAISGSLGPGSRSNLSIHLFTIHPHCVLSETEKLLILWLKDI